MRFTILPALLAICIQIAAFSQSSSLENPQELYLSGRDHYNLGRYTQAMESFESLTNTDNPFQKYASFFYAISAYNSGNPQLSREMFLQIRQRFKDWDQMDNCNLWIAKLYFESQDYFQAMYYLGLLTSEPAMKTGGNMKVHYFSLETDETVLANLLESFPEERTIAENLARKLSDKPLHEIDFEKLSTLVEEYNLDPRKYKLVEAARVVKKDRYNIGALLPFMFDELQPQRGRWSNQFILDIYEGMKYGVRELQKMDIDVRLYAFDTQRDSTITANIVASGELDGFDVLVGPLYTGPSKVIMDYSFQHQINSINPLSNNAEITGNNPFSFLYQSSSQSMAEAAAAFVSENIENKVAAIFYGDSQQDAVLASEYRRLIEADSFEVVIYKKILRDETRSIFDVLMASYQVPDSMDIDKERKTLDVLYIQPDSIGHIFAASQDLLFGSTMISTVENRGDTIQLIGSEEWTQLRSMDFNVVEKLGVWFMAPNYFERPSEKYKEFRELYLEENYELPTRNIILGYNLALSLGLNLNKYGKYFQIGRDDPGFESGYFRSGYKIGKRNDNAWVPIIRMQDGEWVWLNKEQMLAPESEEESGN